MFNSTFINLLVVKVLEGALTMEQVPVNAREQVQEILDNSDLLVDIYLSRIMNFQQEFDTIPENLKPLVEERLNQESTNFNMYVAQIIDGIITLADVPDKIRTQVKISAEYFLGKKLD